MRRSTRLACVSVDLDEVDCYHAIHGLPPPPDEAARAVYDRALPRLAALFEQHEVRATFFAIGRDVEVGDNASALRALHASGHEIGNHSLGHRYDLTRLGPHAMLAEVRGGADAIERAVGVRPTGFRAPGYTFDDGLARALVEAGVAWDSSVFPCPSYWSAKTAAIGAIALRGRRSHSVAGSPAVLLAPSDPYRLGKRWWRRGHGLLEMPIGVTRLLRLPYIGTSLVLGGAGVSRALTRQMVGRPLVTLELHGIDLADAGADGLSYLAPHQPDLRVPPARKRDAIAAAFATLREHGYRFVTHSEAAGAFDEI